MRKVPSLLHPESSPIELHSSPVFHEVEDCDDDKDLCLTGQVVGLVITEWHRPKWTSGIG